MSIDATVRRLKASAEHFGPNAYPVVRMEEICSVLDELEGLQYLADKIIDAFDARGPTRKERLASAAYKAQALSAILSYDVDAALMESLE